MADNKEDHSDFYWNLRLITTIHLLDERRESLQRVHAIVTAKQKAIQPATLLAYLAGEVEYHKHLRDELAAIKAQIASWKPANDG